MSTFREGKEDRRWKFVVCGIIFLLVSVEIGLSVFYILDDAFIHLRFAQNLLKQGTYTYNGDVPSHGTSSPLYTALLAPLSALTGSVLLPKVTSLFIYGISLLVLALVFWQETNVGRRRLFLFSMLLIASPFGIRWLTDGMETGLILLCSVGLAILGHSLSRHGGPPRSSHLHTAFVAMLASAASVLLRVEFLFVLAFLILGIVAESYAVCNKLCPRKHFVKHIAWSVLPLMIGAILGVGTILATFGDLLPDTAIAKHREDAPGEIVGTLASFIRTHIGSSFFGIGTFMLWLGSAVTSVKSTSSEKRYRIVVLNSAFFVFLALLIATQQIFQGVRHFVFLYAFLITTNVLSTERLVALTVPRALRIVCSAAVLAWITFDAALFFSYTAKYAHEFQRMANADLAFLRGVRGIAYDIGMIGYFTGGHILDAAGLVNGRNIAHLNESERLRTYASQDVEFLYVSSEQLDAVQKLIHVRGWTKADCFDFSSPTGVPNRHWLILHPRFPHRSRLGFKEDSTCRS
jgi:hypothetical protein